MTMDPKTFFGLTFLPFQSDVPDRALWKTDRISFFIDQVKYLMERGGFAMISGDPGVGKSKIVQLLAHHCNAIDGLTVGVMQRPQSSLMDFYRELGEVFGISLSPANRYGSFKSLRAKWKEHLDQRLFHPLLLIDEAQEMPAACLNELRFLSSERFDSHNLLTTVLSGDSRLPEKFSKASLIPLGTRISVRLMLEAYSPDELTDYIDHQLEEAGKPGLMSDVLKETIARQSAGNLRIVSNTAHELLREGAKRQINTLDEKLYIELFSSSITKTRPRKR